MVIDELMLDNYYENLTTDITDIPQSIKVEIFPNPIIDILYINTEVQMYRIEILSISGQLINVFENPGDRILINNLKSGFYILKFTSAGENFILRKIQKL